ncbi:YczE/YyaS/YitT family protein [Latilactobacillus fuchuensis]|uniref:Integral membrane protein n=1 Tax=Latilactobacillus fuchuensis TaxID=164393 RepID=A0A2N9DUX1_9LACO|nr:hypothetical protein [Latilactobacillus fuchuensis]SPC37989.1 Integral membrane protein [Latilactobacillus fuchuensis]
MYSTETGLRRLKVRESLFFFGLSILLNAAANALTVATNLGSAIWTASAVNLSSLSHISLGTILAIYGVVVIILNTILLKEIVWRRIIGNLLFVLPFSYLVQFFTGIFRQMGVPALSVGWRIGLDLGGVVLIAIAISIYQRVNLILHPNDDLSYILRFDYFHGRAAIAQYVSYTMPIIVIISCWLGTGQLLAFNIGTIASLIIQGPIIGWADQVIFRHLKHRRQVGQS